MLTTANLSLLVLGQAELNLLYTLLGLIAGFVVGLTSFGIGSIVTPILILLFKVPPILAVGSAIVFGVVTKGIASFQHREQHTVDRQAVTFLLLGSVPAAAIGSGIVFMLRARDFLGANHWIERQIGFVLLLLGLCILAKDNPWVKRLRESEWGDFGKKLRLGAIGSVVGFIFSTTSIGSGSLSVLLLSLFMPLAESRVVGTAIVYGFVVSAFSSFCHIAAGNVEWALVGFLLLGSVPGVLLGSKLALRAPRRLLRTCFSLAAIGAGWKLI